MTERSECGCMCAGVCPLTELRLLYRSFPPSEMPEAEKAKGEEDVVNHPSHYTSHPSGVECITVTEHMNFCVGSAMKYLWRAGLKGPTLEDLKKARWYIDREIARLEKSDS